MAGGNQDVQFGTLTFADTYTAFTADLNSVAFIVRNLSGKQITIRKVGGSNTIVIEDGFEAPVLLGDPAGYEVKNTGDSSTITIETIQYDS